MLMVIGSVPSSWHEPIRTGGRAEETRTVGGPCDRRRMNSDFSSRYDGLRYDDLRYDDLRSDGDLGDEPGPPAGVSPVQAASLAAAVDGRLRTRGCDHSLRAARDWAVAQGLRWADLRTRLEGNGGYCDCEVLLNVIPPEGDRPG